VKERKSCAAYTDGTYNFVTCYAGYAYVIIRNKIKIYEDFGVVVDTYGSKNVTGECTAVLRAVDWAIYNGYTSINIYHDYTGIEYFVTGRWGCKTPFTQYYSREMWKAKDQIDIYFNKVQAHAEDAWNNYVDKVCRRLFK
jgi:ribonuclease HI